MCRRLCWLAGMVVGLLPACAVAQNPQPASVRVFILTMEPGDAVYERFGHNAIRIVDPSQPGDRADVAFNFGMFDFEEKNFLWHFLTGRMHYWIEAYPSEPMVRDYSRKDGRTVWQQELHLSEQQAANLRAGLFELLRPENKRYLYDYYTNNCSTKVRDALDAPGVLDGALKRALSQAPTQSTYRDHTRLLMRDNLIVYTALYAVLGPYTDRPLNAWEECFLPMKLQEHLRKVNVPYPLGGTQVPLVVHEQVIARGQKSFAAPAVPGFLAGFLTAGIVLGGLLVAAAYVRVKGPARAFVHRLSSAVFLALSISWLLVMTVGGMFILGIQFSTHVAAHWNENLLQVSVLAAPLLVLVPAVVLRRTWAARPALYLAGAILASNILGLLLQALPSWNQVNGETIAMTLPVHLGLAGAVYLLTGYARPAPRADSAPGSTP
jgi:hypothetical protein